MGKIITQAVDRVDKNSFNVAIKESQILFDKVKFTKGLAIGCGYTSSTSSRTRSARCVSL